jgi:AhpD family alkylhydroperoxidase
MTTNTTSERDFELRMKNPAFVLPDGFKGIGRLLAAVAQGGVPQTTLELVGLRASQVNGCTSCVQGHWEEAKKAGESDERIITVSAWRESPYFDDAERAALALTDALTRLADRSDDPVPDELWREVVKHYDERQVAALILQIATLNLFNRINVAVREQADRPSWKQVG